MLQCHTMANKCKVCKKFISPIDGAKCNKCMGLFHPGCIKLSPGHRVSSKWKCPTCQGERVDTKVPPKSPSNQSLVEISDKNLSQSVETSPGGLAEEVRQVIRSEMSFFRDELERICATVANFNRRVDAIETRLTSLEERVSAWQEEEETRLSALENRVAVTTEREDEGNVKEIISNLQNQLNDREQEYFLNDVEISGLQEKTGENLIHIVSLIGKKLGVALDERDVVSVERSGPRHAVSEGETQPRPRVASSPPDSPGALCATSCCEPLVSGAGRIPLGLSMELSAVFILMSGLPVLIGTYFIRLGKRVGTRAGGSCGRAVGVFLYVMIPMPQRIAYVPI